MITIAAVLHAQQDSNWKIDIGFRFFKYSASGFPNEISFNPVFDRWERVNQNKEEYTVSNYKPLEPLYFNMNFGGDFFIRYKKHLLIKLGYDYSNPLGIGGTGNIDYVDLSTDRQYTESKSFSYTSHQITYFVGPIVPVGINGAEIYLGFSVMSPTWVMYRESYARSEDGVSTRTYDRTFTGFFGSCRALMGIQIPVLEKLRIGSEATFSFLNYMPLTSGDLKDNSFQFPAMKWNFTVRYTIH
jgi:hypothetical protein